MSNNLLHRLVIEVSRKQACLETGTDGWAREFNETTVSTRQGLRSRLETIAKTLGGSRKSDEEREARKLEPTRQILRKIRKKAAKKADRECFFYNYNQAQVQFLCLQSITLDHETEFALKRLYLAAAHIVKTIEILERDE